VLYGAATLWYALALPAHPDYLTTFLPATLLTGTGIAFALPMLTSASVNALGIERLGVGSGTNATARQLGGVLGVSILVAIVGHPVAGAALGSFHAGWIFISAAAFAAALLATRLERRPSVEAERAPELASG
jgi:hypothetical protein